jgi:uncharacterized damage-inducible protein DinB
VSRAVIDRYAEGGPLLRYAVTGLAPEHATATPGPGAWSIAQLVAHLLDTDLVFAERIKRVIAEDEPILSGFDENLWIERLGSGEMPVSEAAELFAANRAWMTRIHRRCSDGDFARAGRHSEHGRQNLAEIVAKVTNHVDHHLRFLYTKRANLGVALAPRYTAR